MSCGLKKIKLVGICGLVNTYYMFYSSGCPLFIKVVWLHHEQRLG